MADLPALLLASLDPQKRKQAEQALDSLSSQPGFLSHILQLSLTSTQDRAVRLSASVYLKNLTKLRWDEDVQPLPPQDKEALRSELVPAMLALSSPEDKGIRAQVAESIALIAPLDFPDRWPTLVDQLVSSLSPSNYNINAGVLETAHSIFNHWRSQARSDALFTEINLVLSKFMEPFLQLFRQTATLLLTNPSPNPALTSPTENYALLARTMSLLLDVYYDFTCQDLPPAIEDSYDEFFGSTTGWFPAFLAWNPAELKGDPDDTTPSLPAKIKTGILEISELFIKLYPDQLSKSPAVQTLVQGVWSLIGSGGLPSVADDHLVSQSLHFISTAIRSGYYKSLFSSKETITSLVQGVVVPNVALREHELEQFEDDPLEFIRLDLSLPGAAGVDVTTRRQAAADVLQALVGSGYETETTEIVGGWIGSGLAEYERDKENWRSKNGAVYMLTAIATRGSTTQHGVTSTNALVDVVKFFSDSILPDLQAPPGTIHPIIQVDAVRFLYTFRNQLTKPQLLSVLPLLVNRLNSDNYVIYTYAAITIDRVLSIKQSHQLTFGQADVRDFAGDLVNILLKKIEDAGTAEKVAENDHLMKCVMRVIVTAKQTLTPVYEGVLSRLVAILGLIAKNPSNPKFDQYIFESISGLMRFIVAGNPQTLSTFEPALFGPFTVILQQDIDQYIPFVFQILAQMLDLHTAATPTEYRSLLPFLLTPTIWQQKGSIPGLVKLLEAFLKRDSPKMVTEGQVASILAVAQQRLIPSKLNDSWGFELLNAVVRYVSPADLKQYYKAVIMSLLTRMQTSKTDKYVYLFARFILFTMALPIEGLGPDYTISTIEEIQPQLWSQILTNFVNSQIPKFPHKDRKIGAVGLIKLLTQSQYMRRDPFTRSWPSTFITLAKLFSEPQHLIAAQKESDDLAFGMTEIDFEEQSAGYQAAYSRLAASETVSEDPVAYVTNPQQFLVQSLVEFGKAIGEQQLKAFLNAAVEAAGPAEAEGVRSFVRSLGLGL